MAAFLKDERKMTLREKPTMKLVIELIALSGPADVGFLLTKLSMSESVIYKACKQGVREGYLRERLIKTAGICGRRRIAYVRTKKKYGDPVFTEKALIRKQRLQREKEKVKAPSRSASPFRHWQDELLFGPYAKPFKPQFVLGRIFRQSMSIADDELEAV